MRLVRRMLPVPNSAVETQVLEFLAGHRDAFYALRDIATYRLLNSVLNRVSADFIANELLLDVAPWAL